VPPSTRRGRRELRRRAARRRPTSSPRSRRWGSRARAPSRSRRSPRPSSRSAARAEKAAPGAGEDGIVWDVVLGRARADAESSWAFYAFLCLATTIAAIAVILDSAILVVGAMVVGPEFGPVAAACVGIVLWRPRLVRAAIRLLVSGFAVAIAVTIALALLAAAAGWIDATDVSDPRPLTGFIWTPDRWSLVVALLAGAAGVPLADRGRSSALVGVFISVTRSRRPATWRWRSPCACPDEISGAADPARGEPGRHAGLGTAVLAVQRLLTRAKPRPPTGPTGRSAP
jgi:uncharacterized hydrophobic protein (TIGR00271 family)